MRNLLDNLGSAKVLFKTILFILNLSCLYCELILQGDEFDALTE